MLLFQVDSDLREHLCNKNTFPRIAGRGQDQSSLHSIGTARLSVTRENSSDRKHASHVIVLHRCLGRSFRSS